MNNHTVLYSIEVFDLFKHYFARRLYPWASADGSKKPLAIHILVRYLFCVFATRTRLIKASQLSPTSLVYCCFFYMLILRESVRNPRVQRFFARKWSKISKNVGIFPKMGVYIQKKVFTFHAGFLTQRHLKMSIYPCSVCTLLSLHRH